MAKPDADVTRVLGALERLRDPALSRLPFQELLDELLDRLAAVLGADTATVLLLDPVTDALRAVASRGLALPTIEHVRVPLGVGMAGHIARTKLPLAYDDIRDAAMAGPQFREAGVRSMLGAPLLVQSQTIGVVLAGVYRRRRFSDADVQLLLAAGERAAWAIDHRMLLDAERSAREYAEDHADRAESIARWLQLLQRVTARLADVHDPRQVPSVLFDEAAGERAIGGGLLAACAGEPGADGAVGAPALQVLGAFGTVHASLAAGQEVGSDDGPLDAARADRQPIFLRGRADRQARYPKEALCPEYGDRGAAVLPLLAGERLLGVLALDFAGRPDFRPELVGFLRSLADQCAGALERARLAQADQASRDRLALIAEVGRLFTGPLDPVTTADEMCRLAVRRFADVALVHVPDESGFRLLAARDARPERQAELQRRAEALPDAVTDLLAQRLASGQPRLYFPDTLTGIDRREDSAFTDWRSALIVPLVAHGRSVGVLALSSPAGRPAYGPSDVETITEIAGRLALALDNAVLFSRQVEIAHTLQRSLLPASLPAVAGAQIAVRYLPGAEGTEVGGDFYDVIPLATGRFGLVVGDVMGRGVRAAALMGQLRAAIRGYALEGHGPAALLARLDRLVGTLEEGLLVTCVYGEWDPSRGAVVLASAGHPPPLLRRPGSAAEPMEIPHGVPLGVGASAYDEIQVELAAGTLLLAFTDGLVESRSLPFDEGIARLAASVGGAGTAEGVCDAALSGVGSLAGVGGAEVAARDDVALLALIAGRQAPPAANGGPQPVEADLAADPESPAVARALVGDALADWQLLGLLDTAALLTSELVTNAVRHAGTPLRLSVSRAARDRVRVAVTDRAPDRRLHLRRPSIADDGGRGLFLVGELADDWGCDGAIDVGEDADKTVWFELCG